ncbi:aminopeptidase YpdF [Moorella mulderi DSM 14980]|uniref:Aminopeptidase YpdF n=1 Tax=Moorella mulderi DSM 14980 TaxID=1122241 RepID=A0A151AUU1_9FIRM|nr:Xaa-Pro peptidase family protein [Moorella mulderi]KYH31371.1 aminopeptidase YpdF [Moorella mulderi DSM 14980]
MVRSERLDRLRRLMAAEGIAALWVRQEENRRYLSGFTGDSGQLIITATSQYLLTDGRFIEQAREEAPDFEVVDLGNKPWEQLGATLAAAGVAELHFEAEHLSYATYEEFLEQAKDWPQPVKLEPSKGLVERLRQVKDDTELALLQKAIDLADAGFRHMLRILRPGITERDIALELEYFLGKQGSLGPSFTTIIAGGPRASLPHGVASGRVLQPGDLVVMDFGAIYDGYHSDLTRTVALAPVDPEWRHLYNVVLEAQRKAIAAIRPGLAGREVDAVAREHIAAAGYGPYFSHGLGHGVGLAVHEGPTLSSRSEVKLAPGMVVTVEPGIYLPGRGGIRIEDVVLVQEDGALVLSHAPKEFIEL